MPQILLVISMVCLTKTEEKAFDIVETISECDSEILKELVENLIMIYEGLDEYIVENYSEWVDEIQEL